MKRIELTRDEYSRQTGFKPDKHSVGACLYKRRNGKDELICEYVFTDGSEMDELERIGRLVDPR
jgi:hypothetical protein